ncbi:MAG: hypothetical protein K1X28_04940 [Parachlamydiales bacterium]|nr:hypothetical protein [Parachlamydiales bacterium]
MNRFLMLFFMFAITLSGKEIQGILLVGSDHDLHQAKGEGIEAVGIDVPGGIELLREELASYIGKPISSETLLDMKKKIILYYNEHFRPVVTIEIPEQEVSNGIVHFILIEGKLGDVICKGNKHFRNGQLKRYIELKKGDPIRSDILLSDVAFMNQNLFRRTDVLLAPGKEENTTDIELITQDRLAWRFYAGTDNTGNRFTGQVRWFAGLNWGNVFGLDHTFSYQFTGSQNPHEFQSSTFHYSAPLPIHHTAVLFGGFSFVHPDFSELSTEVKPPIGHFKSDGFSGQFSFRYQIPWGETWISKLREVVFGFDYKYMNNNLEYIGNNEFPVVYKSLSLFQWVLGCNYGFETARHKINFTGNIYGSPGKFFGHGSNGDFNNLRRGAKNHYIYSRLFLSDTMTLSHGFSLALVGQGQLASSLLLPSEQFGIGGYNTVRGYDERDFDGDYALLASMELRFPFFSFIRCKPDAFTFLGFIDFGRGWNYNSLSDEKKDDYLLSIGPGARYVWSHYLTLRADWGFKLHKDHIIGTSSGKFHFGAIASY